ncbi:hypothetical protein TWF481_002116 [Arthrobotrys musiformis]|uniref:EF-hand domain-containing protein n=1 Tax=Arthrobotrys musiformis TaxID=47236 RepID=A0AAV9VS85_9PEZI
MAAESTVSLALEDDWSRELQAAPNLIHIMGICAALTSKKEVLTMEIQDSRLTNKGLLPNLLHLSNCGQSAFHQVHSDTYKIAIRSEDIGRDGGYIDRIIKNFDKDDPRAKRRLERALNGLEEQVKLSKAEGQVTEATFSDWRQKTEILHEAVTEERRKMYIVLSNKIEGEKEVRMKHEVAEGDKIRAEKSFNEAKVAADDAKNAASKAYNDIRSAKGVAGKVAVSMVVGTFGPLLYTAFEGLMAYNKARGAERAKHTLELQSDALKQLERDLQKIGLEVDATNSETERWKAVYGAVDLALQNLTGLQHHIQEMVKYFRSLSDQIEILSEKCHEKVRRVVQETESDEDGKVDEEDLEELLDSARQIKAFALVVHAKARVYASVSQTEIFRGFQLINTLGNCDPLSIPDEEYIERSAGELDVYRRKAESGIAKSVYESKQWLFAEYKKLYPTLTDDSPLNPARQQPPPYTLVQTITTN